MTLRLNSVTKIFDRYFRLMESYRDADGHCTQKTLLTIGVWNDASIEQINKISSHLNERKKVRKSLFDEEDKYVKQQVENIWQQLLSKGKVDVSLQNPDKRKKLIYEDSLVHKDDYEIGAEWPCYQALVKLDLKQCLIAQV